MEHIEYTIEEIQQQINDIYSKHPYLENRKLTSDCVCCEYLDVQEEYGHDAGSAWERLDMYKWLLGE